MEIMQTVSRPQCYVCGSDGYILYESLNDRLYDVPGTWNLKRCQNKECELAWLDPLPLPTEIHKAYRDYFTHAKRGISTSSNIQQSALGTFFRRLFYVVSGAMALKGMRADLERVYLPHTDAARMLEVGCGDGYRLARMRGFGWRVEGQEIDPKAAHNASETYGLTVHLGELTDIRLPVESYDAIIMVHVLEHMHEPLTVLRECYRLLKFGGRLVCVTPNIDSFGHKYFKSSWLHLDPPRHIYLFSMKSIGLLFDRLALCDYYVNTTPASAEYEYTPSMSIKHVGKYIPPTQTGITVFFQEMIFQRRALARYKRDHNAGEEIVATLIKHRPHPQIK